VSNRAACQDGALLQVGWLPWLPRDVHPSRKGLGRVSWGLPAGREGLCPILRLKE
jgi:hypothetical protein